LAKRATIEKVVEDPMHVPRRSPARMCLFAAGVLAAMLVPGAAQASQSDRLHLELSWRMAPPTLRLQPEGARLLLQLPPEWLPPPDLGRLGVPLDPNVRWNFHRAGQQTTASLGQGLRLEVVARSRSLGFGLTVLPRAAVAELRFDPLPPHVR
jgi:hypothetical protein